jgi:adenylate cyclase
VIYRFENHALDLARGRLMTAGGEIELPPKPYDLLRYMVENAGRLISKEEIVGAVWDKAVVTDQSLARCVSDVRAAIGDHAHSIIKTVPRRGYLFAVDVVRQDNIDAQGEFASTALAQNVDRAATGRASIAVLPFTNMGGDPTQEYFSDGLTEDIITELSRFSELLVIARNSTFRYKGKASDIREIGRDLDARYVLEGSVRQDGDRVRITAQLIDTVTGGHRWAERYDRTLEGVLTLQAELAHTIVAILAAHLNKAETELALTKPAALWRAHDHYMRATHILASYHRSSSKDELHDARRAFRNALAVDPDFSRAHSGLSTSYASSWVHRWDDDCPWQEALDRACACGYRAVQLDPNLPQAHVALGWALIHKRQHDAAMAEFNRARVLNPNFTDFRFASALVFAGEPAKAIQAVEGIMRMDPFFDSHPLANLGFAHYMLEQYAEGLQHLLESVSRAPNSRFSRLVLAATFARLGKLDSARAEAAEVLRIDPGCTIEQLPTFNSFKHREDQDHFSEGLRLSGLP